GSFNSSASNPAVCPAPQSPASRPTIIRSNDPSFLIAADSTSATVNGSGWGLPSLMTSAALSAFIANAFRKTSSAVAAPKQRTVMVDSPVRSRNCSAVSSAFSQKILVTKLAAPRSASRFVGSIRNSLAGISGSRICLRQTRMFMKAYLFFYDTQDRFFIRRTQQAIQSYLRDLFSDLFLG